MILESMLLAVAEFYGQSGLKLSKNLPSLAEAMAFAEWRQMA